MSRSGKMETRGGTVSSPFISKKKPDNSISTETTRRISQDPLSKKQEESLRRFSKDLVNTLSEEQKESLTRYVAKWGGASLLNLTLAIQAFMLPCLKTPAALATEGKDTMTTAQWCVAPWFFIASLLVNVPQVLDFLPQFFKKLKKARSENEAWVTVTQFLLAAYAALPAGVLAFESFVWIPQVEVKYIVCGLNASVATLMMTATRTIGFSNMCKRFSAANNTTQLVQEKIIDALKLASLNQSEALNEQLNTIVEKHREEKTLFPEKMKQIWFEFLTNATVIGILKQYIDPVDTYKKAKMLSLWSLAIGTGIASTMTFSQKCVEGIEAITGFFNYSGFEQLSNVAKIFVALPAGLMTGSLYLDATLEGLPLIYDTLKRAKNNPQSLAISLALIKNVLAACGMFTVGLGVANNPKDIFELPGTNSNNAEASIAWLFAALNAIGAFTTNARSYLNLTIRQAPTTLNDPSENEVLNRFLFWIEKNFSSFNQKQINTLIETYDPSITPYEITNDSLSSVRIDLPTTTTDNLLNPSTTTITAAAAAENTTTEKLIKRSASSGEIKREKTKSFEGILFSPVTPVKSIGTGTINTLVLTTPPPTTNVSSFGSAPARLSTTPRPNNISTDEAARLTTSTATLLAAAPKTTATKTEEEPLLASKGKKSGWSCTIM